MSPRESTRSPLWKVPVDEEVRQELDFHLEMRTAEYKEQGLSEAEARAKALERFGDPARHATDCRDQAHRRDRRFRLADLVSELRFDGGFALRQARRRPGLAVTILTILALGIGATVALFALLHSVLLRPLPFSDPDELVVVWEEQFARGTGKNVVGPANFMEWRDQSTSFERLAGFITIAANLTGHDNPQRAAGRLVTDGYFEILGRAPLLGRHLLPEDAAPGGQPVVVLSHRLWQQRFGGRKDIIGQALEIDGRANQIVGVMPADFELDMGPLFDPLSKAGDFWWPLPISEAWREPRGRWLIVIGRLANGATLETASTEMATVSERLREKFPSFDADWGVIVEPLHSHVSEAARTPLLALFGVVVLVLLIVCVNVASLLVGSAAARTREVAIRSALGAGRSRVARQLFIEGGLLSVTAAILGVLVAMSIVRGASWFLPEQMLSDQPFELSAPVLGVATLIAVLCSLFFGILPSVFATRNPFSALRSSSSADLPSRHRLRSCLVFVEVSLAVVLLFGAGLMLRTVRGLLDVDPGFDHRNVSAFSVTLPRGTEAKEIASFYDRLLDRLESLPGVEAAGAITAIPMASVGAGTSYYPTDRSEPDPGKAPNASIRVVRGNYFQTMSIPVVAGRALDLRDRRGAEVGSILVNETLAKRHWSADSPLGKELVVSWGPGEPSPRVIVGVVQDVHQKGLEVDVRDAIYFPHDQEIEGGMSMVIRADRDPDSLVREASAVVRELDPKLPIFDVQTLGGVVQESLAQKRFLARTITLFAVLALFLAALGIYGVTNLSVTQRTREMGLRMALGAAPLSIAGMVLRQTGALTVLALAGGALIAMTASRFVDSLLYGVRPTDPLTLVTAAVVLLLSAGLAALLPARRASRTAPTEALRE